MGGVAANNQAVGEFFFASYLDFFVKVRTLGSATSYSSGLAKDSFAADGIAGLAFQQVSAFNSPPFFQTMVSQGAVKEAIFGLKLAEEGSELYLGGTNAALFTGTFTEVPVTIEVSSGCVLKVSDGNDHQRDSGRSIWTRSAWMAPL